jgi:DNA-binding protein Alba
MPKRLVEVTNMEGQANPVAHEAKPVAEQGHENRQAHGGQHPHGAHQHGGQHPHGAHQHREKRPMDDNVVYIGKKGVMNYVMAAITQLNRGEREVHVKARGRSISKAVDVVQLLKNRFETNSRIKNIEIGTEEVEAEEGGRINVSTIDIVVTK